MTARRPSRISAAGVSADVPRYDEQFRRLLDAFNEDRAEHETPESLQETVDARILRFARDLSSETVPQAVHPALTDYGPESAATFFRQARANHPPTRQRSPAPFGARNRPSNKSLSRAQSKTVSKNPILSDRHLVAPSEHPELLKLPDAEHQRSSETPVVRTDAGKAWRCTSENPLWVDENQSPSRRKGPKRARRTSNREETDGAENPPQIQNIPHGADLLRDMRLRRVTQRNQGDLSEHDQTSLMDQDTREPAENSRAVSRDNSHNRPVSADAGDGSMQDEFQATGRGVQAEDGDDVVNAINRSVANLDPETLPVRDQSRPFQMRRAHYRRTSLCNRRSIFSSPSRSTHARRQLLRDRVARALLQPRDHEREGSDNDSISSQDGSILDMGLTVRNPSLRRLIARHLSGSLDGDESEDIIIPFLEYVTAPVSSTEQEEPSSLPSASTATIAELFLPHHTPFRYEQIAPTKTLGGRRWGEQVASCHRISAQGPSKSKVAKVSTAVSSVAF